ncbi:MAG TPA: polysaccharide biosynthesis/export family protein [Pyrinomonadaceae bacterium]|jgi:protein involved in polysaccharide export with SLBB domain|nr:polysaccharide biosynthesis/export family protein [Pyrinomonadaceae bacterium]
MKIPAFTATILGVSLAVTTSAQVKSVAAANNQPTAKTAAANQTGGQAPIKIQGHTLPNAMRARVMGPDAKSVPAGSIVSSGALQARDKPDFNNHTGAARLRRADSLLAAPLDSADKATPNASLDDSKTDASNFKSSTASLLPTNTVANVSPTIANAWTQVYRVGVRDVLDIQLSDLPGRNSTLFTVLEDGVLEYPLAGNPIVVAGLTTPEIAALLRQRIKIFDNPTVAVAVRDYASHAITISGFVAAPGTKILRREAMPLYGVLAEALVLPEAARATITRQGSTPIIIDLTDTNLSATLVVPDDVIKVSGPPVTPTEFYFVGGEINSPGQKPYHAGLTLTQAILASGGTSTSAGPKVRVSRQGPDGRLNAEEYNLRKIQTGKSPDPVLQNGDRIELMTAN